MHEKTLRHLYACFDLERFNIGLYNPRRPPTPEEFPLNLKVKVESLKIDLLLSQPLPPPQYGQPPRRSPAAGTGTEKPGEPHPEIQQMGRGGTMPLQAGVDVALHVDFTRIPEQGENFSF